MPGRAQSSPDSAPSGWRVRIKASDPTKASHPVGRSLENLRESPEITPQPGNLAACQPEKRQVMGMRGQKWRAL